MYKETGGQEPVLLEEGRREGAGQPISPEALLEVLEVTASCVTCLLVSSTWEPQDGLQVSTE